MFSNSLRINISKDKLYLISAFSLLLILFHLFANAFTNYGIFRDELYYIACSKRLAAGYVDQPPFSIYVLYIIRIIFGDSLFAIRFLPAVLSGLTVFLVGIITNEMGGGKIAITIASIAVTLTPVYLGLNTIYSMNCIDLFLWAFAYLIVLRLMKSEDKRLWFLLGLVFGIGLLNKISMGWFIAGFYIAFALTEKRKYYKTIYPWLTAVIALIIFSPFIIWNITHNFAHLEFIRNASSEKYSGLTRLDFVKDLIFTMDPISIIVWLPGVFYYFFNKNGKNFIQLGIIFLTTFLILLVNPHTQAYYMTPAMLILFPAGSILIDRLSEKRLFAYVKYSIIVLLILTAVLTPFALPLLPVKRYIAYAESFGIKPSTAEGKKLTRLPQFYADMFGWQKFAETVSTVYQSVPDSEKAVTVVYTSNYGEAGAIEYYSKKYSLPAVICPQNNYWYWGLEHSHLNKVKNVIVVGGTMKDLQKVFGTVDSSAVFRCQYCMPYENNQTIFIGSDAHVSLMKIFIRNKRFI